MLAEKGTNIEVITNGGITRMFTKTISKRQLKFTGPIKKGGGIEK